MSWPWIVICLVLFGVYLSASAGRLDRLHHRVEMAMLSLDAQLLRRTGAVLDVSASGLLDPATSLVLADAALAAREADGSPLERSQIESNLTKAITACLGTREQVKELTTTERGRELVATLSGALHRAAISRRFYNDAVRACRAVRSQRLVRWFRLAGRAPYPEFVEMDDYIPPGFQGR
jgi:hypothetical protein